MDIKRNIIDELQLLRLDELLSIWELVKELRKHE